MRMSVANSMPTSRRVLLTIFAGMALCLPSAAAERAVTIIVAQANCDSMPAGPARTDCYIGLSRLNRQDFEIAAGAAQRGRDAACYVQCIGNRRKGPSRAPKQRWWTGAHRLGLGGGVLQGGISSHARGWPAYQLARQRTISYFSPRQHGGGYCRHRLDVR